MKQIKLILVLLFYTAALFAQEDSISCVTLSNNLESSTNISLLPLRGQGGCEALYIGLPLVAAGLIEMHDNKRFRSLRDDFVDSDYKHEWENYAQYSPAAVMLAMKALGVESQSSWGKMMTAGASASVIQFCTTHAIKRIAKEERPDGSRHNSFPSGHTATAFMAATMLHKEYGHISPWISIGGYTVATTTGVMRMVNNRHWMSDVLAGAGIGIMSAEFGYWIADLCFPKSNKSFSLSVPSLTDPERKPSFIGLNTGIVVPLKKYPIDSPYATTATGATAGIEGAYFFDNHWGVGAQASVSNMDISPDIYKQFCIDYLSGDVIVIDSWSFATTQAGGYFSQKFCDRLFLRAKILGGAVFYQGWKDIQDPRKTGFCGTAGISLGLRAKDHFDVTVGIDYTALSPWSKSDSGMKSALIFGGTAAVRL